MSYPKTVNVVCPKCKALTMMLLTKRGLLGMKSIYHCGRCMFEDSVESFKKAWAGN